MAVTELDRRTMLKSTGAVLLGAAAAGCSSGAEETQDEADDETTDGSGGDGGGGDTTVAVGPNGDLAFDPEEITVSTGTTVTWEFESPSHNVYAYPGQDKVSIPDGAEGFGSVPKDSKYDTNDEGATFEHTFETAGEYQYVCVPHVGSDMIGTVVVE